MSVFKKFFTKDSKILLLGGTGFLGSHLYKELKDRGYNNVFVGARNVQENKPDHIVLDISKRSASDLLASKGFDIIYNLTGQVTRPMQNCLEQNSTGCINIANAVNAGNTFLIHLSTVGVFGSVPFADENTGFSPETPYSTSKAIAETIFGEHLLSDKYSLIRISNLYGDGQSKGVFAYLLKAAASNRQLEFNNDGSLTRYYLHVKDCARALTDWIETGSGIAGKFNFVGTEKYTLAELIKIFEEVAQIKFATRFEPVASYDNTLEIDSKNFYRHIQPLFQNDIASYIAQRLKNTSV